MKYDQIWENPLLNASKKILNYICYVHRILTYNCSTWISNKKISQSLNVIHKKHLRAILKIRYPKIYEPI